ncbi:class F sortase [Streptomyces tauricus]|uniref:class F sortase n=1 Tax=Streptomyces tauricus TaxID=68274 RepID=UPI00387F34B5
MSDDPGHGSPQAPVRRGLRGTVLIAATALAVAGGSMLALGAVRQQPAPPDLSGPSAVQHPGTHRSPSSPLSSPLSSPSGQRAPRSDAATSQVAPLSSSPPVQVKIPAIKMSSRLERLGLDEKSAMQTPQDPAKAGWYTPGPTPGAKGPAVIAGHVTWNGSRAVFFDLATLERGDAIDVARQDGTTAHFTVDRVAQYPKDKFPTIDVYRNIDHAGLRLITCGGTYSQARNHYADNIVVYAHLTGHTP